MNYCALLRSRQKGNQHRHRIRLDALRPPKVDPVAALTRKIVDLMSKAKRKSDMRQFLMAESAIDQAIDLTQGLPVSDDRLLLEDRLYTIRRNILSEKKRRALKAAERFSSSSFTARFSSVQMAV